LQRFREKRERRSKRYLRCFENEFSLENKNEKTFGVLKINNLSLQPQKQRRIGAVE